MCTALTLKTKDKYFGRTLDIDRSFGEEVVVMPREYPLRFRECGVLNTHFAMIGMAAVVGGIPLFYEAANEKGLAMAGLNFPKNAFYAPKKCGADNIAPFEFIPWVLAQCDSVKSTRVLLSRINIADIHFSDAIPNNPLHWMISDGGEHITVEAQTDGFHVYDNPVGVLTNNPPFPYQLEHLSCLDALRVDNENAPKVDCGAEYSSYSQGMGAIGLCGDVSSPSRFLRIAFAKKNSVSGDDEKSSVGQFFHLLSFVEMPRGICKTDEGTWDITLYTSCINTDRGIYYYTTYGNRRISAVDMNKCDLSASEIFRFPIGGGESIRRMN